MRGRRIGIVGHPGFLDTLLDLARAMPEVELVPGSGLDLARARLPTLAIPPLAVSLKMADEMIACFRATETLLVVEQRYRFHPAWAYLQSELSGGKLGDLLYAHLRCRDPRHHPDPQLAFLHLTSMQLDLLHWLWPQRSLIAEPSRADVGNDPQLAWIYVHFADGALGLLEMGWNLPGARRAGNHQLPDMDLHLVGTDGVAEVLGSSWSLRLVTGEGWAFPDATDQLLLRRQLEHVLGWVDQDRGDHPSVGESRSALEVALAAWARCSRLPMRTQKGSRRRGDER